MRRLTLVPTALAALACFIESVTGSVAASSRRHATEIPIVRKDPRLDALVPRAARMERVADGFTWVEGPVWDRKSGALLFSDIPNNVVFRWKEPAGARRFLSPSGYTGTAPFTGKEPGSNGLAVDPDGCLVFCAHGDRAIVRIEKDGTRTTLADRWHGRRLNSPNDLVLAKNGDLLFTDPPFGLPKGDDDPGKELPFSGVYRLMRDGRLALLAKDAPYPNGIAFSPDEKTLYISNAEAKRAVWLAFDVNSDGSLGTSRVFFDATSWVRPGRGNPDGLKVDRAGNLFASGPGGLHVFAPDGTHLGTFAFDVPVSNCNWGEDGSTLFVTASTAVYRVRLSTKGPGF